MRARKTFLQFLAGISVITTSRKNGHANTRKNVEIFNGVRKGIGNPYVFPPVCVFPPSLLYLGVFEKFRGFLAVRRRRRRALHLTEPGDARIVKVPAQSFVDVVDDARVQHLVNENVTLVILGRQKHEVILRTTNDVRRSLPAHTRAPADLVRTNHEQVLIDFYRDRPSSGVHDERRRDVSGGSGHRHECGIFRWFQLHL